MQTNKEDEDLHGINDTNAVLASRYFELLILVEKYEKEIEILKAASKKSM